MFQYRDQQIRANMGAGDITLSVAYSMKNSHVIMEYAGHPNEIGVVQGGAGVISKNECCSAPIILSFSNVESINAMIYALLLAKNTYQKHEKLEHCNEY